MQNGTAATENNVAIIQRTKNVEPPYDQAILLPGVYPKELKSGAKREFCPVPFAALLTIHKIVIILLTTKVFAALCSKFKLCCSQTDRFSITKGLVRLSVIQSHSRSKEGSPWG